MTTTNYTTYARAGAQSIRHALDLSVTGVTVNGVAATFTDANGVATISLPTFAGGETVVLSGTQGSVNPVGGSGGGSGGGGTASVVSVSNLPATQAVATAMDALTDRSGTTAATPNAFTMIAAANAARQYFRFTNTGNALIYLFDKTGSPALAKSMQILPGQQIVFDAKVSTAAMQVASANANVPFEAAEG